MIRILIDENLPSTLATTLGCPCLHATDLGEQLTDKRLWDFSRTEGFTLLTKDADFFEQLALEGSPPKVIWLRTGNLRRVDLEAMLVRCWPQILAMLVEADLVEVHGARLEGIRFPR